MARVLPRRDRKLLEGRTMFTQRYTIPVEVFPVLTEDERSVLVHTREGGVCIAVSPEMISRDRRIEIRPVKREGRYVIARIPCREGGPARVGGPIELGRADRRGRPRA